MIVVGDALTKLRELEDNSVDCCVTSPPYWGLRDYGVEGQLGNEPTPEEYVAKMVEVFKEVRRVLKKTGTCWLNLGDSYATGGKGGGGSFMKMRQNGAWEPQSIRKGWRKAPPGLKDKDLVGIPWRVAFALQADGWYLRQDIVWQKPNPMPESVRDRCTKAHEYVFLLTKNNDYWFDHVSIKEPSKTNDGRRPYTSKGAKDLDGRAEWHGGKPRDGKDFSKRNKRSVWTVPTRPYKSAHFATMPPDVARPCITAGCPEGGTVLDPFFGAGTTGVVALELNRRFIGVELNPEYAEIAKKRIFTAFPEFEKQVSSQSTEGGQDDRD